MEPRPWQVGHGGRPPRVRGRRRIRRRRARRLRKTPACAGTTTPRWSRRPRRPEDPRVCGDDGQQQVAFRNLAGRPPRVRGRPGPARPDRLPAGKTPACAGTTIDGCARRRDHPGRPPRVRGRRRHGLTVDRVPGKTPACAGTTPQHLRPVVDREEDPRVCGDDGTALAYLIATYGRPPRVRGRRPLPQ